MPTLKLMYFDGKGRGEPIRWLLAATQLPHEEDRYTTMEQFLAIQPSMPYGQVPVLVVDGEPLAQTVAISRYVGTLGGLVCADQFQDARGNEMVDTMAELASKWFDVRLDPSIQNKAVGEKELHVTVEKVFRTFESRISTKFLLSDKLSWQDVVIGHFLSRICEVRPDALQPYPKLKRVMENVLALEGIKKYLANPRHCVYPEF